MRKIDSSEIRNIPVGTTLLIDGQETKLTNPSTMHFDLGFCVQDLIMLSTSEGFTRIFTTADWEHSEVYADLPCADSPEAKLKAFAARITSGEHYDADERATVSNLFISLYNMWCVTKLDDELDAKSLYNTILYYTCPSDHESLDTLLSAIMSPEAITKLKGYSAVQEAEVNSIASLTELVVNSGMYFGIDAHADDDNYYGLMDLDTELQSMHHMSFDECMAIMKAKVAYKQLTEEWA